MSKMLVFLRSHMCPLGSFEAGDVAHQADDAFADSMIAAGVAKETTAETRQADSNDARRAAGKVVRTDPPVGRVEQSGAVFEPHDEGAMQAAGVIKPASAPGAQAATSATGPAPASTGGPAAGSAPVSAKVGEGAVTELKATPTTGDGGGEATTIPDKTIPTPVKPGGAASA